MTAPAVVFDLDGTLIDSLPDLLAAVNRMLGAEGQPPMDRAEVQSYVGDGAPRLVARVMAARGLAPARHAALSAALVADYTAHAAEATRLYPGVAAALADLAAAGHPLGLCTNKPLGATRAVIGALGLGENFAAIIGGDSLTARKPDPAPLWAVFAELGRPGIYVGDSEVDARAAEAAGVPFLLHAGGYLRVPRSEIRVHSAFDDFAALPGLVADLAGVAGAL
ncbi:MAG: phosphoglycolate phosphatase [Defluviimonas sp.]|uniref:phosphoglycolate phosphatase n=1 Tax=Albidovulum sp. TaxID=1872424 RepID=UPI001D2F688E|nr:phosphoglycolate phosphatase [Paracoccaceae bacterium]MCC0064069.1 phosphoglycolate phosphatase [Defluviimonas sp.]